MSWVSNLKQERKKKQEVVKNISAQKWMKWKQTQNREMINEAKYWFYKIKIRNSLWNQFLSKMNKWKYTKFHLSFLLQGLSSYILCLQLSFLLLYVSWKVVCEIIA